jgi:flagellin
MISLQTNVSSLEAQQNLNVDNTAQSKTIEQLTTGYRINSSGDDAAGLAIANAYTSSVAELTQGVSNANDGTSQLQIIDGGLSNISTILNRLTTLATQSASSTFTGSRATLNQEYQQDVAEITRQASNINLNAGGSANSNLAVFIGGTSSNANASVNIDLSGTANAVDATSLGLASTNVLAGGVDLATNTQRLDAPGATFLAASATQAFNFNLYATGGAKTVTATVTGNAGGITSAAALTQLNGQLSQYGITAGTDANGLLQFSGSTAFNVESAPASAGTGISNATTAAASAASNTSNYITSGAATYHGVAETLQFQTSAGQASVALLATDTAGSALSKINAATAQDGVYAVLNAAGTGIDFQGANSFSVTSTGTAGTFATASNNTAAAPTAGGTNNATAAITAINSAIASLGLVQGAVGAGENKLTYATNLANSQIASFSSAESSIKDADVAADASDLTKSQVLIQTAVAALAQANSSPQAILKLLQ